MKERPILFSAPMVQAILAGNKTQTRRAIKPQPVRIESSSVLRWKDMLVQPERLPKNSIILNFCPYGKVGDQLWVRETWQPWHRTNIEYDEWEPLPVGRYEEADSIEYRATSESMGPWKPSIHMPRKASRIQLEITGIRVERLQDINDKDAESEGIKKNWCGDLSTGPNGFGGEGWVPDCGWINYLSGIDGEEAYTPKESFETLWQSINGLESWDLNPWVWVVEFKQVEKPCKST